MKTYSTTFVVGVLFALVVCIPSQGCPQQMTFGQTYLNQTLDGEREPNLLCTDFRFQLDAPDAGGMYRVRLQQENILWQRVEAGPKWKNLQAFYSLDMVNGMRLNGGGVRLSQSHFRNTPATASWRTELMGGVYDRGLCAEATCSVERNGFVGKIAYEYRKLQDTCWWGPSLSVGWELGW